MTWLNSNDYDRGYNDGYNDAMSNRAKNYNRSGLSMKFAIHGQHSLETYCEGYDEGYCIGCRDKNR